MEPQKEEPEMMSEEELLKLLLVEDEDFHDEGRDAYMDVLLEKMREGLGTGEEKEE